MINTKILWPWNYLLIFPFLSFFFFGFWKLCSISIISNILTHFQSMSHYCTKYLKYLWTFEILHVYETFWRCLVYHTNFLRFQLCLDLRVIPCKSPCFRSSRPEVFYKKGVFRKSTKFTEKCLCFPAFSCEFCKVFRNTIVIEHIGVRLLIFSLNMRNGA